MLLLESSSRPSAVDGAVEPLLSWLEAPLREFMIQDPVSADEHDTVRLVQARMSHSGAGHLPVVSDGRPVGLVTASDLARSLAMPLTVLRRAEIRRLLARPISAVMSAPAITLSADATLEDAVQLMVRRGIGSIVVVDPLSGELVGLVTRSTITRAVATLGSGSD